jgi:hypothetical protein
MHNSTTGRLGRRFSESYVFLNIVSASCIPGVTEDNADSFRTIRH